MIAGGRMKRMRPSFETKVRQPSLNLTDVEDEIIDWLRKNCTETTTLREISEDLFIAPNTVFRMAKKLGYCGFSEMRYAIVSERDQRSFSKQTAGADEEIWDSIWRTINLMDAGILDELTRKLKQCRKIRVRGFGPNEYYCRMLVSYLQYGDIYGAAFDEGYSLEDMDDRDMLIFISNSGETPMLVELAEEAKSRGIFTVAVTNAHGNSLQKLADISLFFYSGYYIYQPFPDYIGLAVLIREIANMLWKKKEAITAGGS